MIVCEKYSLSLTALNHKVFLKQNRLRYYRHHERGSRPRADKNMIKKTFSNITDEINNNKNNAYRRRVFGRRGHRDRFVDGHRDHREHDYATPKTRPTSTVKRR